MSNSHITIAVVNLKSNPPSGTIRCCRPTPLGNPFPMANESEAERNKVCERYKHFYYTKKSQSDPDMGSMFHELMNHAIQNKVLNIGCFCAPQRCHLDTVKEDLIYELTKLGFTVS